MKIMIIGDYKADELILLSELRLVPEFTDTIEIVKWCEIVNPQVIIENEIDLIVTLDLQGFEWTTIMGGLLYNLYDCKEVHILRNTNLAREKFLENQISISMFFYCTDEKVYKYYNEKYPNLPYLELLDSKKIDDNLDEKNLIMQAINKTAKLCHIV